MLSLLVYEDYVNILMIYLKEICLRSRRISSFFTKESSTLKINTDYVEDIKNNIIVHPNTLSIIYTNLWSEEAFGGYLLRRKY